MVRWSQHTIIHSVMLRYQKTVPSMTQLGKLNDAVDVVNQKDPSKLCIAFTSLSTVLMDSDGERSSDGNGDGDSDSD
jgi:hypothetical protein